MNCERINVLLVEDDDDHAELVIRRLDEHDVVHRIVRVADGESALEYLYGRCRDDHAEWLPIQLILLDLRLPKIDGLEVLRTLKIDEQLRRIPVVVLTTSAAHNDVLRAQDLCANAYVVKPVDFDKFGRLMRDLGTFWLGWNQPPGV